MDKLFDKIFIINLDHRKDRWEHCIQKMENNNITNYERFSAIKPDINDYPKEYYNRFVCPKRDPRYKIGALGCKLSHYNIIKLSKERNYKNILILEDDFVFQDNINQKVETVFKELDFVWHMLYLGGNHEIKPEKIENKNYLFKSIKTYTTHAYAMNNKLFDLCLKMLNESGTEIDVFYSKLQKKFKIYSVYPSLILQKESYSDIMNTDIKYNFD